MAETVRQVRRQPEESIVIDNFTGGMELRVASGTLNRIICNMYPRTDTKELEGIRGDYTYEHAMTAWAGSSELSWMYDLHNEHVAVFRKDETKFYILDNAGSPALTSITNTTQYGTKAYEQPVYSTKRLSTTIGGWLVHGNPWYGFYESIRGPSTSLGTTGGIQGAFQQTDTYLGNPYRPQQVLSITESGFFSSKTTIHTQQLGLPVPIGTGLHISTTAGTAFAGSRHLTSANDTNTTVVKTGTEDWMGERMNLWALCTDNGIASPHGNLVHKFHFATNGYSGTDDFLIHNVYTQNGGQRIYTDKVDVTGAYLIDDTVAKPLACCSDNSGNIYVAFIKDANEFTVKRFAPGATGAAYTVTTQDVTCSRPFAIQMEYDKYSDRVFIFVTDDIADTYDGSLAASSGHGSIIRVFRIAGEGAPSTTAAMGIIANPYEQFEITHFTADFMADGYDGDNDLANANKRCLFFFFTSKESISESAGYWGYFDTTATGSATTLLSMCNQTDAAITIGGTSMDNPGNGGVLAGNRIYGSRRFAVQMGIKSRKGSTCDVVISYGSNKCGWDLNRDGIKVYKSKNCSVTNPDLSVDGGTFSMDELVGGYYGASSDGTAVSHSGAIHHWRDVDLPIHRWNNYDTVKGGTVIAYPAHRGDCLNRLSIHGDSYLRWEITDTQPNPVVKVHYNLDTMNFDAYKSTETWIKSYWNAYGSEQKQKGYTGFGERPPGPYEYGGVPPKPTGYPESDTETSIGCSVTPHWQETQSHIPTNRGDFETDITELHVDFVNIFFPMSDNNTPFLAYPSYGYIPGETGPSTKEISVYCHPPIHGGAVYHNEIGLNEPGTTEAHRRDFGELRHNSSKVSWMKNNKLYSGANFHPLTPFSLDGGETAKKVEGFPQYKTWNDKNPILAGQDINVLTKVKTIKGNVKPGKYRYKFSFAKAGAEEQAYKGTGGEGAIFWDTENEAFFEWDSTRSVCNKGIRLFFNMGLLRKTVNLSSDYDLDEATHLMELNAQLTDNSSNALEMKPVWDGTPNITMPIDKSHGPACRYDYWHAYDIITSPFTHGTYSRLVDEDDASRITLSKIDEDAALSSRYGYKILPHDPAEYGGAGDAKFQHDSGSNLAAGKKLYRHGKRTFGQTFESVSGKAPYVKKLIVWRTGNIDLATTDQSKYYKVGEFELEDTDDSRGWSGYYFDDVFDTLELSGQTGDRDKLPPITENITAIASAGGRLFIAHNPQNKRDVFTASRTPSQIQFSGSHWENFPRKNVIILDDSAVVHRMKAFQGNLFVFTDIGVYIVSGIDNPATMSATKISEMIIHSNENDSETIIDVEGSLFCVGTDGLYQLLQGGLYKISKPMEEWFAKKSNLYPVGMYYDKNTQSVIVYDKTQSGTGSTIKFKADYGSDTSTYIDAACYHIATKSWWCKGNASSHRRRWEDVINVAHNTTSSSQQSNTLPHSLVYGIKQYSSTVDNIIQIGRGWGEPTINNTAGTIAGSQVRYYYESAVLGNTKVRRYWDRVDVEVIPVENGDPLAINTGTLNLQLDNIGITSDGGYNSITAGGNVALSYKDVYKDSEEDYISLPKLIETADVDVEGTYVRLRLNMTWHARANSQTFYPPRLKAIRFRTRITGISREK